MVIVLTIILLPFCATSATFVKIGDPIGVAVLSLFMYSFLNKKISWL